MPKEVRTTVEDTTSYIANLLQQRDFLFVFRLVLFQSHFFS